MKCREARRRMLESFDEGTLKVNQTALAKHLHDCPRCRLELDRLLRLEQGLEQLPMARPEDSYWISYLPRLRSRMEAWPAAEGRKDRVWATALGLALLLTLFIFTSPTRIGPPIWFAHEPIPEEEYTFTALWEEPLTDRELESFAIAADRDDILKNYLDRGEIDLINVFSNHELYQAEEAVEQLSQMDDASVAIIFENLKSRPIIRS